MFSHLSNRELLLYSVSTMFGLSLLSVGLLSNGNYNASQNLATAGYAQYATTTVSVEGGGYGNGSNFATTTQFFRTVSITAQPGVCNSRSITISWGAEGSDIKYRLYRGGVKIYNGTGTSYVDTERIPGENNSYFVFADASGVFYEIAQMVVRTPPDCPVVQEQIVTIATTTVSTTTDTNQGEQADQATTTTSFYATTTLNATVTTPKATTSSPTYVSPVGTTSPVLPTPKPVYIPPATTAVQPPTTTVIAEDQKPKPTAVQSVERSFTSTSSVAPTTISSTTEAKVVKLFDVVSVFDETSKVRAEVRRKLIALVDEKINEARAKIGREDRSTESSELEVLRQTLISQIDARLSASGTNTRTALLINDITVSLQKLAPFGIAVDTTYIEASVSETLTALTEADTLQTVTLKEQGGDQLYKDSNKDGISDYESVHVYNIDPIKPSPVSVYEGRTVTAGEKVLLGFDPSQAKLVSVEPEEPETAQAPIAHSYTVSSVELTDDKKLSLVGKALPNSFVTLYVYSTPVIVTVKTDADGTWKYTLNKELADGSHTVSVATVDTSGKILAKSTPIPFTKTAQAATLDGVDFGAESEDPSLFSSRSLYMLLFVCFGIIFLTLGIMGLNTKKEAVIIEETRY